MVQSVQPSERSGPSSFAAVLLEIQTAQAARLPSMLMVLSPVLCLPDWALPVLGVQACDCGRRAVRSASCAGLRKAHLVEHASARVAATGGLQVQELKSLQ